MSDALEFSVRINMEDYVVWSLFLQKRRMAPPAKSRLMLWFAWAVFGFALFWLFDWAIDWIVKDASSDYDVQIPKEDLALLALAPAFFGVLAYAAYAAWAGPKITRNQLRAMMAGVGASTEDLQVRWSVDDSHITVTTPHTEGTFQWSAIMRVEDTETHLFLVSYFASALMAPKRNLTPHTLDALRAILRGKGLL